MAGTRNSVSILDSGNLVLPQNDPGAGNYSFRMNPNGFPQMFLYQGLTPLWRSGTWTGQRWNGIPEMTKNFIFNDTFVNTDDQVSFSSDVRNASIITRAVVNEQRNDVIFTGTAAKLTMIRRVREEEWNLNVSKRRRFIKVPQVKVPDTSAALVDMSIGLKQCEESAEELTYIHTGQDLYIRVDKMSISVYKERSISEEGSACRVS
ncbi:hypothetical protein F3Y22_tig00004072pilonHSYRG00227 [Hibiscus syriacus]|uniref:S-locus glycoprotein domain-containing protein n=1 Tax=Hibiscus syriacus TaxID=106335 RepID=A0A6A3CJ61_HIBSY|nr:hypothetical protein F3Y22_tig00004072pilonHSYRG00227 [Hibiscus syriacus]